MSDNPRELVRIKHPDVNALGGPVPRSAVPLLGDGKWEVATPEDIAAAGSSRTAGKTVAQLRDYAEQHGIDLGKATTKAAIIAVIDQN